MISIGVFDRFFGKKTTIRLPNSDGYTTEYTVTLAWLKKMQSEGKIDIVSENKYKVVFFHIVGTDGSETRQIEVGKDIPWEQYNKLADTNDGSIYGISFYENGVPKTVVVSKSIWAQAKSNLDQIDGLTFD